MPESSYHNEHVAPDRYNRLLKLWAERAHKSAQAHYRESEYCSIMNKALTTANAALSISVLFIATASWLEPIIVGKSQIGNGITYQLIVSLLSLFVVLTTIMHYLFDFHERAMKHKSSGQDYSALMKKIERYQVSSVCDMDSLHIISKQYAGTTKAAPLIPSSRWNSKELEEYSERIRTMEEDAQDDLFSG